MRAAGDVAQRTRARVAADAVVVRRRSTRSPGSLMRACGDAAHSCKNSGRSEAGTVVVRRRGSRLQQKTTAATVDDDAVDNRHRRLLVVSSGSVSIANLSIASSSCRAGSSSVQASSNNEHIQFTKSNKQQEAVK
uniref:Uncharacterized protein n=1 Tax=Oryza meridionalis TaxID=40149 RepID=A0A0E0ESY1_9ORYZ